MIPSKARIRYSYIEPEIALKSKTKQTTHAKIEGYEQELEQRARRQREHEDRIWAEWWETGGIFEAFSCPELAVPPSERTQMHNLKIMLYKLKLDTKDQAK